MVGHVNWSQHEHALEGAMRVAKAKATEVYRIGRNLVEYDELLATGYEWIAKHAERVIEDGGEKPGRLARDIRRAMLHTVERERLRVTGARPEDLTYYTVSDIERLLPLAFEPNELVMPGQVDEDTEHRAKKAPNEGNDYAASVVDVSRALSRLPEDARVLLQQRYDIGLEYPDIARLHGLTAGAAEKRVKRTLFTILDLLGGEAPWRDRRPRGNAHAQAITNTTLEGGSGV